MAMAMAMATRRPPAGRVLRLATSHDSNHREAPRNECDRRQLPGTAGPLKVRPVRGTAGAVAIINPSRADPRHGGTRRSRAVSTPPGCADLRAAPHRPGLFRIRAAQSARPPSPTQRPQLRDDLSPPSGGRPTPSGQEQWRTDRTPDQPSSSPFRDPCRAERYVVPEVERGEERQGSTCHQVPRFHPSVRHAEAMRQSPS